MTTTTTWTPMSKRRPTEADLPIWYYHPCRYQPELFTTRLSADTCYNSNEGSWMKATLPAPPPRELTQREKDEAHLRHLPMGGNGLYCAGFNDALAYRDAENAKDLALLNEFPAGFDVHPHRGAVQRLRQRAGMKV